MLRLKSSTEQDAIRMQPGSGETHVLYVPLSYFHLLLKSEFAWIGIDNFYSFPDSLGDDLIIEVHDSKGKHYGRVLAQVATIAEDLVFFWSFTFSLKKVRIGSSLVEG